MVKLLLNCSLDHSLCVCDRVIFQEIIRTDDFPTTVTFDVNGFMAMKDLIGYVIAVLT